MRWHRRVKIRTVALLSVALAGVGLTSPAAGEDPRLACATAAEQAQLLRSEHKLQDARREFLVCAQPLCPAVVRNDCVYWLSEVDKTMPSVVIKAIGPANEDLIEVSVSVDGVRVLDKLDGLARAIDPGIRLFRFEAAGMVPVEQQLVIREGETHRMLAAQFHPQPLTILPDNPPPFPVLPFVLGGIGTLALGSFAYFGIEGRAEASELAGGCGATKSCSDDQVDPVRRKLIIADLSLGASLVSFGVATYLLLSHGRPRPKESTMLQVSAGHGSATMKFGVDF